MADENKKAGYQGLFLSEESKNLLAEKQLTSLGKTIDDMHITFQYGSIVPYTKEQQKNIQVKVVGYACDGKNSAFEVELPDDLKELYHNDKVPPHITVSVGNGGKPKDSGYLKFEKLDKPFVVEGSLQNRIWEQKRERETPVREKQEQIPEEVQKQIGQNGTFIHLEQYLWSIEKLPEQPIERDKKSPRTREQDLLKAKGIVTGNISQKDAVSVLKEVQRREAAGYATPKEIKALEKTGFRHVGQWSHEMAGSMIFRLQQKTPQEIGISDPSKYRPSPEEEKEAILAYAKESVRRNSLGRKMPLKDLCDTLQKIQNNPFCKISPNEADQIWDLRETRIIGVKTPDDFKRLNTLSGDKNRITEENLIDAANKFGTLLVIHAIGEENLSGQSAGALADTLLNSKTVNVPGNKDGISSLKTIYEKCGVTGKEKIMQAIAKSRYSEKDKVQIAGAVTRQMSKTEWKNFFYQMSAGTGREKYAAEMLETHLPGITKEAAPLSADQKQVLISVLNREKDLLKAAEEIKKFIPDPTQKQTSQIVNEIMYRYGGKDTADKFSQLTEIFPKAEDIQTKDGFTLGQQIKINNEILKTAQTLHINSDLYTQSVTDFLVKRKTGRENDGIALDVKAYIDAQRPLTQLKHEKIENAIQNAEESFKKIKEIIGGEPTKKQTEYIYNSFMKSSETLSKGGYVDARNSFIIAAEKSFPWLNEIKFSYGPFSVTDKAKVSIIERDKSIGLPTKIKLLHDLLPNMTEAQAASIARDLQPKEGFTARDAWLPGDENRRVSVHEVEIALLGKGRTEELRRSMIDKTAKNKAAGYSLSSRVNDISSFVESKEDLTFAFNALKSAGFPEEKAASAIKKTFSEELWKETEIQAADSPKKETAWSRLGMEEGEYKELLPEIKDKQKQDMKQILASAGETVKAAAEITEQMQELSNMGDVVKLKRMLQSCAEDLRDSIKQIDQKISSPDFLFSASSYDAAKKDIARDAGMIDAVASSALTAYSARGTLKAGTSFDELPERQQNAVRVHEGFVDTVAAGHIGKYNAAQRQKPSPEMEKQAPVMEVPENSR